MKIIKDGSAVASCCTGEELSAINAFAKSELRAEDVYTFSVLLCDNEVDRDCERFSVATLRELGELFVGATTTGAAIIRSREFTERSSLPKRAGPRPAARTTFTSRATRICCAPRQTRSSSRR